MAAAQGDGRPDGGRGAVESMTGFAAVGGTVGGRPARFEIRSVNHRSLVWKGRLPWDLPALEHDIDRCLRARFRRGSFQLHLSFGEGSAGPRAGLDFTVLDAWVARLDEAARRTGLERPTSLADYLNLPGVVAGAAEPDERERAELLALVERGLAALAEERRREGQSLARALQDLVGTARERLRSYEAAWPNARRALFERLRERAVNLLQEAAVRPAPDESAIARELALAVERFEVQEELTRLGLHLEEFGHRLAAGGEVGRGLEFLVQEALREANTLLAKTQDAGLAARALELKETLERMREQVQNLA